MNFLFKHFLLIIIVLFAFIFSPVKNNSKNVSMTANSKISEEKRYPKIFNLSKRDKYQIEEVLSKMTLQEKIAQMVMPALDEKYYSDSTKALELDSLINYYKVTGFVFLRTDIRTMNKMIDSLQRESDIPLLTAADFERGLGMRLQDAIEFPYNMAIAATGNKHFAYLMGKIIAEQCKYIGINYLFAPVVDINNNPENPVINLRSFSEDKDTVSAYTVEFLKGFENSKILTTVKHFPGHGDTKVDSHLDLPVLDITADSMKKNELVPFEKAISAGVKSIMIGHLSIPSIDSVEGIPATFSSKIVTKLLKQQLGFEGLIITDALRMEGISKYFSPEEAAVLAVNAGNDILLMPQDVGKTITSLANAVAEGKISTERIEQSVRKILSAKKWLNVRNDSHIENEYLKNMLNEYPAKRLAKKMAERSITLIKNDRKIIPLKKEKYRSVSCIIISEGKDFESENKFAELVDEKIPNIKTVILSDKSSKKEFSKAEKLVRSSPLNILPVFLPPLSKELNKKALDKRIDFINKILKYKTPSIVISYRDPYLIGSLKNVKTYLVTFGSVKNSLLSSIEAILGEQNITGKLPVSIPKTKFKMGFGLTLNYNKLIFPQSQIDSNYNFTLIEQLVNESVNNNLLPGGTIIAAKSGKVIYKNSFGKYSFDTTSNNYKGNEIFNLGNLSPLISIFPAVMLLYDNGKLDIDKPVNYYLPQFKKYGKEKITVRNLIYHSSGLTTRKNYLSGFKSVKSAFSSIMNEKPVYKPGTKTVISELDYILLQLIVERITELPLNKFLENKFFKKLEMNDTKFNLKTIKDKDRIPFNKFKTETADFNDYKLYDSKLNYFRTLYSTADDLSKFAQMIIQNGYYENKQIISEEIIKSSTGSAKSLPLLEWQLISSLSGSAVLSFHSNTGISIWIDKNNKRFVIFLTNQSISEKPVDLLSNFRSALFDALDYSFDN